MEFLIKKELYPHSFIPSTLTVCPKLAFLIPETKSGQSPEKGTTVNVYLLCKKFQNNV